MEATEANLDIKFTQLKMAIGKTNTIIEAGKTEAIERHLSTLRSLTTEINRMRLEVEATKIGAKEELADIEEWNTAFDAQLEEANLVPRVFVPLDQRSENERLWDKAFSITGFLFFRLNCAGVSV